MSPIEIINDFFLVNVDRLPKSNPLVHVVVAGGRRAKYGGGLVFPGCTVAMKACSETRKRLANRALVKETGNIGTTHQVTYVLGGDDVSSENRMT